MTKTQRQVKNFWPEGTDIRTMLGVGGPPPVSKQKKKIKKPVAYLGIEKVKTKGKDKKGTILAYPDSPRSDRFKWIPLYK